MPGETDSPSDFACDEFVRQVFGVDPRSFAARPNGGGTAALDGAGTGVGAPVEVADADFEAHKEPGGKKPTDSDKVFEALNSLDARFKRLHATYDVQSEMIAYQGSFARLLDAFDRDQVVAALKLVPSATSALDRLEAAIKAKNVDFKARRRKEDQTAVRVRDMKDEDIQKLGADKKLELVKDLIGSGEPNEHAQLELKRIYALTDLDPAFRKEDQKHQQGVADSLKKDPYMVAVARQKWSGLDPDQAKQRALNVITRAVKAHSAELGIAAPEIVVMSEQEGYRHSTILAFFDRDDGRIHVNLSRDRLKEIKSVEEVVDTAVHESAHHYQTELVALLESKKLKQGDPLYEQAVLFEANLLVPGGELGAVDAAYTLQPTERHSTDTGPGTAKTFMEAAGKAK